MNIKHIFGLLCLTTGLCLFQACSDVPAPYDIPAQGEADRLYGSGTLETPYTVRGAALNQNGGLAWVKAYIVGYIPQSTGDGGPSYTISDVVFSTDEASATNIVIADNPAEKDINNCMAVQLPSGDVRSALNLADHPENIGKEIMLYGTMTSYYGGSGVKSVTAAILNGQEIGDMPKEPAEAIFNETFEESLGGFTINNVSIDPGMGSTEVWTYNSYKYAQATSYINSVNYAAESWLISPAIDLTQVSAATLTFDYLARYFNTLSENITVWVTDATNESWEQLDVELQECNDWNFVKSGDIDLSTYKGKSVKIGFKYDCDEKAGTFRLKNFLIEERAATADTPITGENLLTNGGFETWNNGEAAGWTPSNTACNTNVTQSSDAKAGSYSAMVEGSAEQNKRLGSSEMTLKAGTYALTVNVKAVDAEASIRLGYAINEADGSISGGDSYIYGDYVNGITKDEWKEATYQFTLDEATRLNLVVMVGKNPGQSILIDEVSLVTSDGGITEGGDTPDEPEESATFTKAYEIVSGAQYAMIAIDGDEAKIAENLPESYNYGRLTSSTVEVTNDMLSAEETATYTITAVNGGYTIQDSYGRYMYMEGSYDTFNVSASKPSSSHIWTIDFDENGQATITNIEKGKWVQYSTQYKNFECLAEDSGLRPFLFKKN